MEIIIGVVSIVLCLALLILYAEEALEKKLQIQLSEIAQLGVASYVIGCTALLIGIIIEDNLAVVGLLTLLWGVTLVFFGVMNEDIC